MNRAELKAAALDAVEDARKALSIESRKANLMRAQVYATLATIDEPVVYTTTVGLDKMDR